MIRKWTLWKGWPPMWVNVPVSDPPLLATCYVWLRWQPVPTFLPDHKRTRESLATYSDRGAAQRDAEEWLASAPEGSWFRIEERTIKALASRRYGEVSA